MGKGLRGIAELFARSGNLLGEHGEMIAKGQHVLEDIRRFVQVFLVVLTGLIIIPRIHIHINILIPFEETECPWSYKRRRRRWKEGRKRGKEKRESRKDGGKVKRGASGGGVEKGPEIAERRRS